MPAEFVSVHKCVILNKYTEPVQPADIVQMMAQVKIYAEQASQPILAIADLSEVNHFPSFMLTTALREGNINPVRNPKIVILMVIADSAFLANVLSVVGRITGSKKIVLVRTQHEANRQIEAFIAKHRSGESGA